MHFLFLFSDVTEKLKRLNQLNQTLIFFKSNLRNCQERKINVVQNKLKFYGIHFEP